MKKKRNWRKQNGEIKWGRRVVRGQRLLRERALKKNNGKEKYENNMKDKKKR